MKHSWQTRQTSLCWAFTWKSCSRRGRKVLLGNLKRSLRSAIHLPVKALSWRAVSESFEKFQATISRKSLVSVSHKTMSNPQIYYQHFFNDMKWIIHTRFSYMIFYTYFPVVHPLPTFSNLLLLSPLCVKLDLAKQHRNFIVLLYNSVYILIVFYKLKPKYHVKL